MQGHSQKGDALDAIVVVVLLIGTASGSGHVLFGLALGGLVIWGLSGR